MSGTDLDKLMPALQALPDEDIDTPDLPMAVALQEAHDVYALIAKEPVRGTLLKVGVAPEAIDNLRKAVNATRIAQSQWVVVRDNRKDEAQRAREQAGYKLRSLLVAACRWNLRSHRVAMATLQGILEGEGVDDLIQDLNDLAELVENHADAFSRDKSFEARAEIENARNLAAELEAGVSAERLGSTREQAKQIRDRAYSYLDDQVTELREAGRYAYRDDAKMRTRFYSEYLRRRRRRSAQTTQPNPPEASFAEAGDDMDVDAGADTADTE